MPGGLKIPKQEISSAKYAAVGEDPEGNITGIVGLAFPNTKAAYPGTDPSKDILCSGNLINSNCGPIA